MVEFNTGCWRPSYASKFQSHHQTYWNLHDDQFHLLVWNRHMIPWYLRHHAKLGDHYLKSNVDYVYDYCNPAIDRTFWYLTVIAYSFALHIMRKIACLAVEEKSLWVQLNSWLSTIITIKISIAHSWVSVNSIECCWCKASMDTIVHNAIPTWVETRYLYRFSKW